MAKTKVKAITAAPKKVDGSEKNAQGKEQPNSRTKLLDAALELFSRHSFHGTTTKMIAKHAGVNEALIMRHFKSKEGLFLAVLETHVTCADDELSYPPQKTLEDELHGFAKDRIEDCAENSDFMRIVLAQALIDPDFRKYVQQEFEKPGSKHFQARLTLLQKSGKIDKKANLNQLEEIVSHQMFAILYMSVLVYELDKRTVMTHLKQAMSVIARGYQSTKSS